jgi:hypothetical protein
MPFLARYRASVTILVAAFVATIGVFVFARPEYRSAHESDPVDLAAQFYFEPVSVKRAFAAEGVDLSHSAKFEGITTLSDVPHWDVTNLTVTVAPRTGTVDWGPKFQDQYDERFGNLLVQYGGEDEELLARVKAAVATLQKQSS